MTWISVCSVTLYYVSGSILFFLEMKFRLFESKLWVCYLKVSKEVQSMSFIEFSSDLKKGWYKENVWSSPVSQTYVFVWLLFSCGDKRYRDYRHLHDWSLVGVIENYSECIIHLGPNIHKALFIAMQWMSLQYGRRFIL